MAQKRSAGLLMYRRTRGTVEVLLAHPGGPFWRSRDERAWTVPKGECDEGEDPLACAQREFREETGFEPVPPYLPLGEARQKSGKRIRAWAFEGDADPARLVSNTFEFEWPPKTGRMQTFPEVDRVEWYSLDAARIKLIEGQVAFVDALERLLAQEPGGQKLVS